MTPFFSSSVCQARVLRRKFIHMGRINMNTMNPPAAAPRPLSIMASGYAISRQRTVLTRDSPRDSHSAFAWSAEAMAMTLAMVRPPPLSVSPYHIIIASGISVKPAIQMR